MKDKSTAPDITVQTMSVRSDGGSHEGRLILANQDLVAVFSRVTAEENSAGATGTGGWFLEAGFGPCSILMTTNPSVFRTLEEAIAWVQERLEARLS
ncbi:hypothetical protein AB4Y85_09060 [Microvirga sp. 2YAF29]|uniref:hypothetical protein n=1 Tax=Microvirga sp. 2YAF29 TaxID=3233031 RepID=UPI003F9972DB